MIAIDSLLTPEINKPARYLGNERGAVHKPWDTTTVRWALTYPEVYEVGSSNLGHANSAIELTYLPQNFRPSCGLPIPRYLP
jgi:hypothetical protein